MTHILGLLLLLVGSTWLTLLVLQANHESRELSQQKLAAVDYDVFKLNQHHHSHRSNSIRSAKNISVHRLAPLTNGRLPKGIDIALPVMEPENSTIEQQQRPSPLTQSAASKGVEVSVSRATNDSTHQTPSHNTVNVRLKEQVTIDSLPSQIGPDSLQMLRDHMSKLNSEPSVRNADKFPPLPPDGIVLIVQVHRREGYLEQLFNSMRNVKGIEKVLLVISHDYYYDDVMKLVQSVDFCRVCSFLEYVYYVYRGTSTNYIYMSQNVNLIIHGVGMFLVH